MAKVFPEFSGISDEDELIGITGMKLLDELVSCNELELLNSVDEELSLDDETTSTELEDDFALDEERTLEEDFALDDDTALPEELDVTGETRVPRVLNSTCLSTILM